MSKFIPIDMPRSKSFGCNYYETYSLKLKRNVRLYSELEYKNFLTLEMDSKITEFCEQPIKINIEIDGKSESTVFDMWVHYSNGIEEMQEVKYTTDLDPFNELSKKTRMQIQKQELWCKTYGYNYNIRTEKVIERGTYYINNLRYLYGLVKRSDNPLIRNYIKILQNKISLNKVMIKDIINEKELLNENLFSIIALGIYEGKIEADINSKIICYDTELWNFNTSSKNAE